MSIMKSKKMEIGVNVFNFLFFKLNNLLYFLLASSVLDRIIRYNRVVITSAKRTHPHLYFLLVHVYLFYISNVD